MAYAEAKVYFDGSHYIAIPHTTRPSKSRNTPLEERVEVKADTLKDKFVENATESTAPLPGYVPFELEEIEVDDIEDVFGTFESNETDESDNNENEAPSPRFATKKEIFEEHYKECCHMRRHERKKALIERMRPYFDTEEKTRLYVTVNIERKLRNLICRRIRLSRKANLQEFNYFCTFTYNDKLHDEESFKRKLRHTISNFSKRKAWKYIGVWERSPEKKRLHFHGLFYIPEGTMPGFLIQKEDYNFNTRRRQITNQNTYFNEKFGRSDFESIDEPSRKGTALAYIIKYIEKTGEKIVYSKGLPQFFISDILESDVVTTIGSEDTKLLLFDDFSCIDEGCYIGVVSSDVIEQLRKAN